MSCSDGDVAHGTGEKVDCCSYNVGGVGEGEHSGSLIKATGRTRNSQLLKMEKEMCNFIPLSTKFLLGEKKKRVGRNEAWENATTTACLPALSISEAGQEKLGEILNLEPGNGSSSVGSAAVV